MNRKPEDILNDLMVIYPTLSPVFQQIIKKYNKQLDNLGKTNERFRDELLQKDTNYNAIKQEIDLLKKEIMDIKSVLEALTKP